MNKLMIALILVIIINTSIYAKAKPSVFWSPETYTAVCEWGVKNSEEVSRKESIFGKKITYKYRGMRAKIKHEEQTTPFDAIIRISSTGGKPKKCIVRTGSAWLIDDYLEEMNK
jgi:hypothetical protein